MTGLKVIELGGIGPAPFCSMLLADLGAAVTRIERPQGVRLVSSAIPPLEPPIDVLHRGKDVEYLDLKVAEGRETAFELLKTADIAIEGFRPGTMERLGLGPAECFAENSRLIYGRMTGWGGSGPMAQTAGHDINYLALTGALDAIGAPGQPPTVPLNLVGDFGGGGLMLAFGLLAALHERTLSGKGQIVDAAIVDGVSVLMASLYGLRSFGLEAAPRGTNVGDGGCPFYGVYECADGRYVAVGALEEPFFKRLLELLALPNEWSSRFDKECWPAIRERFAERFMLRSRDEWCRLANGSDACVTPVLDSAEAPGHPHAVARGAFFTHQGVTQPAPAPRFSRTPAVVAETSGTRTGEVNHG
ncbi:CaiB/BaiF CoA transferase family protein [Aliihoeflea sp. 2WW]|uniref:CaiB/BaiF CoA transferase family protein n=1 Tax=Aliihoeflea sp. 2WW TaxID=1381123 RepID=UPI001377E4ED|nr:CaiB/BaiF CoA-transferase family protein [Aliihoeflea sp. 2WW]